MMQQNETNINKTIPTTISSSTSTTTTTPAQNNHILNNHNTLADKKQLTQKQSTQENQNTSNVTSFLNLINDNDDKASNTLDFQKQRLNQLIELISNQEAKLNRLKALKKLAKDQTAINLELSNELTTVNNSISEKDIELRQALNRVDNLNRQLTNYRRTRAYRNSKNVTASKQLSTTKHENNSDKKFILNEHQNNTDHHHNHQVDENLIINQNKPDLFLPSANGHVTSTTNNLDANTLELNQTKDSNLNNADNPLEAKSSKASKLVVSNSNLGSANSDDIKNVDTNSAADGDQQQAVILNSRQDLMIKEDTNRDILSDLLQKNCNTSIGNNAIKILNSSGCTHLQNHSSPAINKYTNARQKLLNSGLNNKSLSSNGRRVSFDPLALLLDAALEGELDLVIKTSKQVPDLSASHDECVTALHNAVVAGHYEVAKYLIEAGCDVNVQDSDGWTPLHCAASCNNLPLVKLLIENNALIYATTTSDFSTPVMKCEEGEEGYEACHNYLMYVQNNLGVINDGIVYALYDYEAQQEDELSFKKGDELTILRRDDSQEQAWWLARRKIQQTSDNIVDIKEGYIPRNLIGLYPPKLTSNNQTSSNNNSNGNNILKK